MESYQLPQGLSQEAYLIQNPALGAGILWRFVCGYSPKDVNVCPVPIPLCYIVLPILFYEESAEALSSTRASSGIYKYKEKVGPYFMNSIHSRALSMRELSTRSISLAIFTELIDINTAKGTALPLRYTFPSKVPKPIRSKLKSAEKLGGWLSMLSLPEISHVLRVKF